MRIATANAFDTGIDTLQQRQSELSKLQEQMTSGKRVERASDDPAAAARAERALASVQRTVTSQRAVDASKVAMAQTESSLGSAGDLMQHARELLVAAGNGAYSDSERQSLANELQSVRTQLFAIANQSDGAGTYLFGGQGATQKPFIDAPGGVQYAATAGQTLTENATGLPLTTDGNAAWLTARTGNGVFVTSAAPGVLNATIDSGRVADPSALTGADYTLQFSVSGGVTTYAVLKNGAATAVTAAPYVSGQAITVDGMTVAVSGTPASGDSFDLAPSTPTLSVFDTLDRAIAGLNTTGRTRVAGGAGQRRQPARYRRGAHQPRRGARRGRPGAEPDRQRELAPGRPEAGQHDRAIERGRCGHGARDLRLSEQAKRLRCGAQVVRDGAAPVDVPVRERQLTARRGPRPEL